MINEREVVSIETVSNLSPIEGADLIEVATIKGWKIVVKKGEHSIGEEVIYCEIDSWIPNTLAPFLSKGKTPRVFNGIPGEKLRTIRLRGQISQGLVLKIDDNIKELIRVGSEENKTLAESLSIFKYEIIDTNGNVSSFPSKIRKTKQERIQNISEEEWTKKCLDRTFEITEKIHGSSMTCFLLNDEFGVCSHNLRIEKSDTNVFWKMAILLDIENKMRKAFGNRNIAIQGELCGPGAPLNYYGFKELKMFVFDIFDIDAQCYMSYYLRNIYIKEMDLLHVPIIEYKSLGNFNIDEILKYAEGKSQVADVIREGLVFKSFSEDYSFKVVSNDFLVNER